MQYEAQYPFSYVKTERARKMYILGRTQMIPAASYEEAIDKIMALGFDGVEINIYDRSFQIRQDFFTPGFAERIRTHMAGLGVKAYSVGAHMDYTESPEMLEIAKKAVEVAARLGAKVMIVNGAHKMEDVPFAPQWERQVAALRELARKAEEQQVLLAVEFEPGFVIDSTKVLLKAMAEIDSPMLKMNLDIGHVFLQDEDPMASIRACGELIVHGHLENMETGVHNHLVPWEGDMDLEAYARAMRDIGFDGNASLDVYQYDYEQVAPESIGYLKKVFK